MFSTRSFPKAFLVLLAMMALAATHLSGATRTVTLNVVGKGGTPPNTVGAYRWLIEEDRTYHPQPGVIDPNTLAVKFHASYMPVVDKGVGTGQVTLTLPDSTKHYFVSVLPTTAGSYSLGGTGIAPTDASVTVYVNKIPIPTAQITVFIYHDHLPLNNAPEPPEEEGLAGFNLFVEDAGGRYGASAGELVKDAFDNLLGTEYYTCADPNQPTMDSCSTYGTTPAQQYQLDSEGAPIVKGWQPLITGPSGEVTIKNLGPGKYGIIAIPPIGSDWQQTHTIEGTKLIDAWVKANEPPFFTEFGPPGWHVFIGFTRPHNTVSAASGGVTLKGCVVNNHMSRPPNYVFYDGAPFEHTTPWVGLNNNGGAPGASESVYASETADGCFEVPHVPAGTYQVAVWDNNLDLVFASHNVTVNSDGTCNTPNLSCDLGNISVFNWFSATHHWVYEDNGCAGTPYYDQNKAGNGFRDLAPDGSACEPGILEQLVNLRWRDGTVYQFAPTDLEGFVPFDTVFPFFNWLVAEVDFARFKPTGVTVVVDNGGPTDPTDPWSYGGKLNPQPQCLPGVFYDPTTGTCPVGQEAINPNSGNNKSRTETGPVLTQAFQAFLGQTSAFAWGKQVYGPTENGGIAGMVFYDTTRAENDPKENAPEVWQPGIPGATVQLWSVVGNPPVKGVLLATTETDSWDESLPTGCQGEAFVFPAVGQPGSHAVDCHDGLRNFNQVRNGVFDGGYAFTECSLLGGVCVPPGTAGAEPGPLAPGRYVVQVVPPTGPTGQRTYEVVKEEDKNVDFGDDYVPAPNLQPWECVGDPAALGYSTTVPPELTLFPGVATANPNAPRKLCNEKLIALSNGSQAAVDFFLFTEVPIAGHFTGMILDDTANEFDPNAPNFGEKYAPPFLPVSIRDWTGQEIGRVYGDKFGMYNGLLPSTFTANGPKPSGMDPGMFITCMNSRVKPDGTLDPFHSSSYSEFCYTFQYMPGTTTYLDTPVVPVAAFAGPNQQQLDCELPNQSPKIKQVSVGNGVGGGPLVTATGQVITIDSYGTVLIPNPDYCPGPPITTGDACPVINTARLIPRDFGFGAQGANSAVRIGNTLLTIVSWTPAQITAIVPDGATTGQLLVTRHDNQNQTAVGLTVQVGIPAGGVTFVSSGGSIQTAIDNADPGELVLVGPGRYSEMVIMWKPVKLQGWGEGVAIIDAVNAPGEKLLAWRNKVNALVNDGSILPLPGQEIGAAGIEPATFVLEEGAGVFVAGNGLINWSSQAPRIDGLLITGSDKGGGVVVNGRVQGLSITNNRVSNNTGGYGGGIRLGHPGLVDPATEGYTDALNDNAVIRYNMITQNGATALGGAGGGVSICTGADSYQLTDNFICGNFQMSDGGGVGHLGRSHNGQILRNKIIFNENFNQGLNVHGGGLFIAGQPAPIGVTATGSGSVTVDANLLLGNLAGAGDGGGIRLQNITGSGTNTLRLTNNMLANNVAGMAGGGISLSNAGNVTILNNTIARNDSTATSGLAFSPGTPNQSNAQTAGLVKTGTGTPVIRNNIFWQNRSFFFQVDVTAYPTGYALVPATPFFRDIGGAFARNSLFTAPTPGAGNISGDPLFLLPYLNGPGGTTQILPETTVGLTPPPAFDEGGNFIRVRYGPLSQTLCLNRAATGRCITSALSNYHIPTSSPAFNAGASVGVTTDFDGQIRPWLGGFDMGADEAR